MSIRTHMLTRAAGGAIAMGDKAEHVAAFLHSQCGRDGAFLSRWGVGDLYYTMFGLQGLAALGRPLPAESLRYVAGVGDIESMDFVHLCCLARCLALCKAADDGQGERGIRDVILSRLETFRAADGGFAQSPGAKAGTIYGCYLGWGAFEDLSADPGGKEQMVECIQACRAGGGFGNEPGYPAGTTPATAAAVVLLSELGRPADAGALRCLLARQGDDGGFGAAPGAPVADLLSTAVATMALNRAGADLSHVRPSCEQFVRSLMTSDGGFRGSPIDDLADCEYTFYAILALGSLQ